MELFFIILMNICVVGTGYVGLVSGICFAESGNFVSCVDIDTQKIKNLQNGILPIYEPELEDLLKSNKQRLLFTESIQEGIKNANIIFIAVGTPMGEDGSADLSYVLNVASSIGSFLSHDAIVVNKSTVPVSTGNKVKKIIQKELEKRYIKINFDVASNPEFLKEGSAVQDFLKPDRVIIGSDNSKTISKLRELYRPFTLNHDNIIIMDIYSAELTKYASNAMLATKISFINEISHIAEAVGADINKIRTGIGSDPRIGYDFIYPGIGYGGSCFPKDVKALNKIALENNYTPKILQAVHEVNESQKIVLLKKIKSHFSNLSSLKFAVWGLSFKPKTDDMREAPSIPNLEYLSNQGVHIQAYDPKANLIAKEYYLKHLNHITYFENPYDALQDADALILFTEWHEFRNIDFIELKSKMKQYIIFDGRNIYHPKELKELGITHYCIGKSK